MAKYAFLILFAIIALASFLRFYKLSANPPGLYWDEVSIGYNAYSILTTGKDEYGKFFPVSFQSLGDYKLPIFIYLAVPFISIFGLSEFAIRAPSALAGVLTIIALYFLVWELFKNQTLALITSFLLAISPWHIQFSRGGFEANLALFFLVLGTLAFLKSAKSQLLIFVSALLFSFSLYTYPTARIFVPLLILVLAATFIKKLRLTRFKILPFCLFALSYLAIFFIPNLLARFNVVSAFSEYPVNEWPSIFLNSYLSYFSFDFLFFQGDQIARHGLEKMGNLYLFEIPLVLLGVYHLLKSHETEAKMTVFTWLLAAPVAAALTNPSPHSLRSLNMVIPLEIISGLGLLAVISWANSLKSKSVRIISCGILTLGIGYFFLNYLHLYYVHYPKTSGIAWQEGNKEMANEVLKRENNYRQIFISDFLGNSYLYPLFYGKIDPDFYRKTVNAAGFGKYQFFGKNHPEKPEGKTLWVLSFGDKFQPQGKLLKEIKITNGDLVYRIWETD